ncbi:fructokinase [Formosa agariphila KMM 3901]|uniref:Fructokinase n=1 Tax=Formosa agariphila (strain DSM 15362 / KCTC 12365 / LMG 23005 / KMM 3901 / M-2Alg 35-1) TaxID=1347342 RepID=T2KIQ1_FORAG|nr:carbohydrate kinase [Formosa agariphila]CDF78767.1 fructokinase [Formosa agariphila KMM 3901]
MKNIVCFGEVLWDVFPTHKKIGGAPLNVALRLQSLGNKVSIITRIGDDTKGTEIADFIAAHGVNTVNVQIDAALETGEVDVLLDENGSASYTINLNRAWDNLQLTETALEATKQADAFVYGSLVARDVISRNTLYELLKVANYKILDINLRAPHYTKTVLNHLMNAADFIKFNDDEIFEIAKSLGFESTSLEDNIQFMSKQTNTKSICVTKGASGAIYYQDETFYCNAGYKITVVDTVGAGDSFLGSLITKLLQDTPPQDAIDYACAVGALVASHEGANPKLKEADILAFITS